MVFIPGHMPGDFAIVPNNLSKVRNPAQDKPGMPFAKRKRHTRSVTFKMVYDKRSLSETSAEPVA